LSYLHDKYEYVSIYSMNEENILIQAGLSEEQASVYKALIERGPQKASALASWTGIKRGLIYKVLEQMEAMGLVSKKGGDGTVATFSPEHPSQLMNIVEQKAKSLALTKQTLEYAIGSLGSKFNLLSGKPNVQFFEGFDGIKKVTFDSLNSKTEILSFADNEAVNKLYPKLNEEYMPTRKKLNIKKRLISKDNPYIRELTKKDDPAITERRVIAENFTSATVMQIYDGKVSYITLDPERTIGVIIEDKSIYEMHRILFELTWKDATPIGPVLEK